MELASYLSRLVRTADNLDQLAVERAYAAELEQPGFVTVPASCCLDRNEVVTIVKLDGEREEVN